MKITLENLGEATPQQVFSQLSSHLLTQGKKSLDRYGNVAKYKNDDGLMCPGGCLLSINEYHPKVELKTWKQNVELGYLPDQHTTLITAMQTIHTKYSPKDWKSAIIRYAESNKFAFQMKKEIF